MYKYPEAYFGICTFVSLQSCEYQKHHVYDPIINMYVTTTRSVSIRVRYYMCFSGISKETTVRRAEEAMRKTNLEFIRPKNALDNQQQ